MERPIDFRSLPKRRFAMVSFSQHAQVLLLRGFANSQAPTNIDVVVDVVTFVSLPPAFHDLSIETHPCDTTTEFGNLNPFTYRGANFIVLSGRTPAAHQFRSVIVGASVEATENDYPPAIFRFPIPGLQLNSVESDYLRDHPNEPWAAIAKKWDVVHEAGEAHRLRFETELERLNAERGIH
ncbi:MAG: hypothetical protein JF887_00470 [Candidatus Dormibacteraeota bacterium]|uniref:Uncharacterized protein n=1 Tax=Candidatus Amunia macphersoniae TaxID=3127014 RepID=A0A934KJL0_9BACT|nr:hypothetical protein [Candidatus Dormibacteraeota bacterium]